MTVSRIIHGTPFSKFPGEKAPIGFDFSVSGALPSGTNVSSATVAAANEKTGESTSATLLPTTTATVASNVVTAVIQNGTAGETHLVTFTCTLDSGAIIQAIRRVKIVEK